MGRRCCCIGACLIKEDEFERANSDDLGDDWTEVVGLWSIDANELKEAGNIGAIVTCNSGTRRRAATIDVVLKDIAAGNKYRIIVNYVDASTYCYAEYYITAYNAGTGAGSYTLTLRSVGNGGDLAEMSFTDVASLGPDSQVRVCYDSNYFAASWMGTWEAEASLFLNTCSTCTNPNGYYVGLGNGSTNAIRFDDFTLSRFRRIGDDTCQHCICTCEGYCVPHTLVATMVDCTGDCVGSEGSQMTLEWCKDCPDEDETKLWKGTVPDCAEGGDNEASLECHDRLDCETFEFHGTNFGGDSCGAPGDETALPGCTCNPIYLKFGPYTAVAPDATCACCEDGDGTFYILVTEPVP